MVLSESEKAIYSNPTKYCLVIDKSGIIVAEGDKNAA